MSAETLPQPVIVENIQLPQPEAVAVRTPEGSKSSLKFRIGATVGALSATVLASVLAAYQVSKSKAELGEDPKGHASPAAKSHAAPAVAINPKLKLDHHRRQAEEALTLMHFYERNGDTDKLQECLQKLKTWKETKVALEGEHRSVQADGLVITRSNQECIEEDMWRRVNKAIEQLETGGAE